MKITHSKLVPSAILVLWLSALSGCSQTTESLSLDPVPPGRGSIRDYLRGFTEEDIAIADRIVPQRLEPSIIQPVLRQVTVQGTVFLDADANSEFDDSEKGLPNILISDGEHVTRTGSRGEFSFSFQMEDDGHHRFVFVTQPTGYRPTTPLFVRVRADEHQTEYFARFGFIDDPETQRREFWFLTTSDTQVSNSKQMIPIAKDYAQMTTGPEKPAFLVTVGDLTSQGTHYEWDTYDFIRGASGVPVFDGYGGHDGNGLNPRSTINYELRIGPPYYSWEYGGVHFIHLITEVKHLMPQARARQEKWLRADLQALPQGMPVIVIAHDPLREEWFDQRKSEGVNLIGHLTGHFHTVMAGSRNGIPVLGSAPAGEPDWGAYARPYRRVYVSPEGVRSKVRIAGHYKRLELVAPGPAAPLGTQPLVVVAYDSARIVEAVTCRVISPEGIVDRIQLKRKGDWSWYGQFSGVSTGRWRFELEARDSSGTVWLRKHEIEVEPIRLAQPTPSTDFPWILSGDPPRRLTEGPHPPLYPLWIHHTGGVHVRHAAPAVWNGKVYAAIPNPNAGTPGSGILCLDARTGEELWRAQTPMGDIPGAVTVHQGVVYALTWEDWVVALNAANGAPQWQLPLREEYRRGRPLGANYTMPVPTNQGLLISQWERPPVLLDYRTGKVTQLEGHVSGGKYAPFITAYEGVIYSARYEGQFAWPFFSTKPLWRRKDDIKSSPGIVAGGKFIFTGESGQNFAKVIDSATGKLVWETQLPNPRLSMDGTLNDANPIPVVWDDLVLANGRNLAALDLNSGKLKWEIECGGEAEHFEQAQRQVLGGHSSPVAAGDLAFFGHDDTYVRAVTFEGEVIWNFRVGTSVNTSPVVSGNLLFVHDYAGNLWCFAPGSI